MAGILSEKFSSGERKFQIKQIENSTVRIIIYGDDGKTISTI